MTKKVFEPQILFVFAFFTLVSCLEAEVKPGLRAILDYSLVTPETTYSTLFVDESDLTTVDLQAGNTYYKMFQALNYYSTSSISANAKIEASKLSAMFSNTGNPFSNISTSTISVVGSELNASGLQLKNVVAPSQAPTEAGVVRAKFESLFNEISVASNAVSTAASTGVAGKLGTYLVDAKGIEIAQIIQKSLIGALQLDYIGNVLLKDGLTADNYTLVEGKNYTQLEHNWDIAYGLLTLNPVYLAGSTNDTRGTVEFAAGSYIWEYNKANYANIHPAFLMGRAAIVNNDQAELEKQAEFIRKEFEKSIANAALGYLDKWKTGTTDAARAHAIGEGLGFIYSLRFASLHGADAAFSDNVLNGLVGSGNGFWDLSAAKINTAADAIRAKFNL